MKKLLFGCLLLSTFSANASIASEFGPVKVYSCPNEQITIEVEHPERGYGGITVMRGYERLLRTGNDKGINDITNVDVPIESSQYDTEYVKISGREDKEAKIWTQKGKITTYCYLQKIEIYL